MNSGPKRDKPNAFAVTIAGGLISYSVLIALDMLGASMHTRYCVVGMLACLTLVGAVYCEVSPKELRKEKEEV